MIPFNKPYLTGKETHYIYDAVASGHISGNGKYTGLCHKFFEKRSGFRKALLTTSCTDALEMCALLLNIKPGDEVIVPSYTFVSTALAFVRQGAKIIFADSRADHPGIDENRIEELITERTRAIVPVHYAGTACNMDQIMAIARRYNLFVVEDAAHAIDSFYLQNHQGTLASSGSDPDINEKHSFHSQQSKENPGQESATRIYQALGSIGHLSAFSFHETKNIQCGEGGLLVINNDEFIKRAEIVWEKGTNRAEYFRGGAEKYEWIDVGSSFLPSEITAAFLMAQLEQIDNIQKKRLEIWNMYYHELGSWASNLETSLPVLPDYATNNAHIFYLVCRDHAQRRLLIEHLKRNNILAVSHYISLHKSPFYRNKHDGRELLQSERYSGCLLRLPLHYGLAEKDVTTICQTLKTFTG